MKCICRLFFDRNEIKQQIVVQLAQESIFFLSFQMIYVIYLFMLISSIETFDYSLMINEKHSITQAIFRFPHSFELVNNFQSNFNLTNNNTELILTKIIDRDSWCALNICSCDSCSFILEFFSNENQIPRFSTMNITVNDINDHTCQFLDLQTNLSLSESIQIGHRFSITRAIDYDSGNNGKLAFRLENHLDFFELDIVPLSSNEYALYGIVKKTLDRETMNKYELILEGHDHGIPQPRINRTKITIRILDENDNAPKFNQTEYSIRVRFICHDQTSEEFEIFQCLVSARKYAHWHRIASSDCNRC